MPRFKRFFLLTLLALTGLAAVLYGIRTPFAPSAGPERLLFAFEAVASHPISNFRDPENVQYRSVFIQFEIF